MPTKGKDGKYHSKVTPAPGVKPIYFEAKTLREFNEKRQQIIEDYKTGRRVRDAAFLDMVDEWFEVVRKPRIKSRSNLCNYQRVIRRIRKGFSPSLLCRAVRYPVLQQFMDTFAGQCDDTVMKVRAILIAVCNYAVAEGAMEANYAVSLQYPRIKSRDKKSALTAEQAEALCSAYTADPAGVIVMAGYYTGARLGELLALRWGDIDFTANEIHLSRAVISHEHTGTNIGAMKTEQSERTIPLLPALRDILYPIRALPGTFVCPVNNAGLPMTQGCFRPRFDRILLAAGLAHKRQDGHIERDITMHWLRHNFASACYRARIPLTVTMAWLGHSDMNTTTAVYADIKKALQTSQSHDDHLKRQLEKVGQKLDLTSLMW